MQRRSLFVEIFYGHRSPYLFHLYYRDFSSVCQCWLNTATLKINSEAFRNCAISLLELLFVDLTDLF